MEPSLHHIIDGLYEASRCPSGWQDTLDRLRAHLHVRSAILLYRNHRLSPASLAVFSGIVAEQLEGCDEAPWLEGAGKSLAGTGELVPVSPASAGSEAARRCYRRLGVSHVVRGWLFDDSEHSAQLELHRGEEAAPFESGALEQVSLLAEHFERALRIHALAIGEQQRQAALSEGLAQLALGVVLFDEGGEVVYQNEAAAGVLRHHPAVQLRQQRLVVREPAQAERLRLAIAAAAGCRDGDEEAAFSALALGEVEASLQCWVMPVANRWAHHGQGIERAVAALYLSDAQKSSPLRAEPLMDSYGLTRKEAEVAVAIASGRSAEEIAQLHSRTLNTVRSQLKAVFRKTGTQRQPELVRLVLDGTHLFAPLAEMIAGEPERG